MRFIFSFILLAMFIFTPVRISWAEDIIANSTQNITEEVTPNLRDNKTNIKDMNYQGIDMTVNINYADASEIAAMLNGIGAKKAQAIVDYRNKYGQFSTIDDLQKVKGIGAATINKNKDRILF